MYNSGEIDLKKYDYIWVADDDMNITPDDMNRSFSLADHFGFWVSSPSHDPQGKISNPFMVRSDGNHDIRIVTYIEVTWPIFRSDMLGLFLDKFDGSLSCWGVDQWWSSVFRTEENFQSAIFDCISAINTPDAQKGGSREITRLVSDNGLIEAFEAAKKKHNFVGTRARILAKIEIEWDVRLRLLGTKKINSLTVKRGIPHIGMKHSDSITHSEFEAPTKLPRNELEFAADFCSNYSNISLFGASFLLQEIDTSSLRNIVSVEAEEKFHLAALQRASVQDAASTGKIHFLDIDLGSLRPNGQPSSREGISRWPNYSSAPWTTWDFLTSAPDLVVVTGPFRKACCLRSLIYWICLENYTDRRIIFQNRSGPTFDFAHDLSPFFEVKDSLGMTLVLAPKPLTPALATHASFLLQRWQIDLR